jgi:hypothetical protein
MSPDAIQARLGADITQAAVDESVMRMLTPMFSVGVMDAHEAGATSVASFLTAVLTEIYLCNVCSRQEIPRRNGRGQTPPPGPTRSSATTSPPRPRSSPRASSPRSARCCSRTRASCCRSPPARRWRSSVSAPTTRWCMRVAAAPWCHPRWSRRSRASTPCSPSPPPTPTAPTSRRPQVRARARAHALCTSVGTGTFPHLPHLPHPCRRCCCCGCCWGGCCSRSLAGWLRHRQGCRRRDRLRGHAVARGGGPRLALARRRLRAGHPPGAHGRGQALRRQRQQPERDGACMHMQAAAAAAAAARPAAQWVEWAGRRSGPAGRPAGWHVWAGLGWVLATGRVLAPALAP